MGTLREHEERWQALREKADATSEGYNATRYGAYMSRQISVRPYFWSHSTVLRLNWS